MVKGLLVVVVIVAWAAGLELALLGAVVVGALYLRQAVGGALHEDSDDLMRGGRADDPPR